MADINLDIEAHLLHRLFIVVRGRHHTWRRTGREEICFDEAAHAHTEFRRFNFLQSESELSRSNVLFLHIKALFDIESSLKRLPLKHHCSQREKYCHNFKVFNPFPNKPGLLRVYSTSRLKTPWVNEKLPLTSNFPFSHSVFYPCSIFLENFLPFLSNLKLLSANSFLCRCRTITSFTIHLNMRKLASTNIWYEATRMMTVL